MLIYYLVLLPFSKLPRRVLYVISDFLFLVLYKIFSYRTKVVKQNMEKSFPAMSEKEIKHLMDRFYRHLCDVIVETIQGFSISNNEIMTQVQCQGHEQMYQVLSQGKSIIAVGGHYNNWEKAALALPLYIQAPCIGIYKPLSNAFLDQKLKKSRENSGLKFISTKEVSSYMEKNKKIPTIYFFLSDQSPSNPKYAYWTYFLGRKTPTLQGAEKYARQFEYPIYYGDIHKTGRGFYRVNMEHLLSPPYTQAEGEITQIHTARLEQTILEDPAYWLWTHKRWKHAP